MHKENTNYINIKKGIESLYNMESVYYKLLETYYNNYHSIRVTIEELVNSKKYLDIQAIIHKIKGISLNLCSEKLYNMTYELNIHLKNDNFNHDDIIKFLDYHDLLLNEIQEVLKEKNVY